MILNKWTELSIEQARGERRRPDLPLDKDYQYPLSIYCALLQSVQLNSRSSEQQHQQQHSWPENLRETGDSENVSCLSSSPLPSLREEPESQETEEVVPGKSSLDLYEQLRTFRFCNNLPATLESVVSEPGGESAKVESCD